MNQQLIEMAGTIGLFALTTVYGWFKRTDYYQTKTNIVERKVGDFVFAAVTRTAHEYVTPSKAAFSTTSPLGQLSATQAKEARNIAANLATAALQEAKLPVPSRPELEAHIAKAVHRLKSYDNRGQAIAVAAS